MHANLIGTDATGKEAIANGGTAGVVASAVGNLIGGTSSGSGNVISGNSGSGVAITAEGNIVSGNFIGTDGSGTLYPLPNAGDGINITGGSQTISGSPAVPQKIFSNGGAGVRDSAIGAHLRDNSISGNAGGGVVIGGSPTTATVALLPDRQTVIVTYSHASPNQIETVELFVNPGTPACPGQGLTLVGGAIGIGTASGSGTVIVFLPQSLTPGDGLTATISDPPNGSSEFACLAGGVPHPPPPPPAPNSNFSDVSAPSVNTATGSISFNESVSDPGTMRWVLTFANGKFGVFASRQLTRCKVGQVKLKGGCRPSVIVFGKGSTSVTVAGHVHFVVKPSPSALKALRNAMKLNKGLSVTATLTFQSSRGGVSVAHARVITVKFKPPRTKGKH